MREAAKSCCYCLRDRREAHSCCRRTPPACSLPACPPARPPRLAIVEKSDVTQPPRHARQARQANQGSGRRGSVRPMGGSDSDGSYDDCPDRRLPQNPASSRLALPLPTLPVRRLISNRPRCRARVRHNTGVNLDHDSRLQASSLALEAEFWPPARGIPDETPHEPPNLRPATLC